MSFNKERRKCDRDQIQKDIIGVFLVEYAGEEIPFSFVHDVSISGMGLILGRSIPVGEIVVLRYVTEESETAIKATIVWNKEKDQGFELGVEFLTDDMDANILFFMAVREYLDNFGRHTVG